MKYVPTVIENMQYGVGNIISGLFTKTPVIRIHQMETNKRDAVIVAMASVIADLYRRTIKANPELLEPLVEAIEDALADMKDEGGDDEEDEEEK